MPLATPLAQTALETDLSVDQARVLIAQALAGGPPPAAETVPLAAALGRVLAADLVSAMDVPGHDNAAMDGFAFDGSGLQPGLPLRLQVVGTRLAGGNGVAALGPGQCLRIMTGAALPPGLDTVVPQELCRQNDGWVDIEPGVVRRGDHRRLRGEDLAQGRPALQAGRTLRPSDLGLMASLGLTQVSVRRALRVALFSTGDEVVAPGAPLPPGCIYDSNRASLSAALRRMGAQVLDLGWVRDDAPALAAALQQAAQDADAVLTSGGVSAGDADHTRQVLADSGKVAFWKVAMRPGRPFAFGRLRSGAWLFALPGNPVAALVAFHVLVREGLQALAGATPQPALLLQARSSKALRKRPGRTEYQRAFVAPGPDGQPQVQVFENQGSGMLSGLSQANALVVLHHDQGPVAAGDIVSVWPLDGLI